MNFLLSLFIATAPATTSVIQHYDSEHDVTLWEQSLTNHMATHYSSDQVAAVTRWLIAPVSAMLRATSPTMVSQCHVRVCVRDYFNIAILALGEIDTCTALEYDARIKNKERIITCVKDLVAQHKHYRKEKPVVYTKDLQQCDAVIPSLGDIAQYISPISPKSEQ